VTTSSKRLALASWARQQIGVREEPPGSNAGPPVERYALVGEDPLPWCARLVRTGLLLFGVLGAATPHDLYEMASAEFLRAWVERRGGVVIPDWRDVLPGDLRFLVDGGGRATHVGIVVSLLQIDNGKGDVVVTCVDGNFGDTTMASQSSRFTQQGRSLTGLSAHYVRFPV
jgi:hypothetical protein